MIRRAALILAAAVLLGAADDPKNYLQDPNQEAAARDLFEEVRCVVCQNENIASSEAPIAQDLRMLIREQVAAGKNEAQIKEFLIARYGDFILLRPRFTARNAVLWITPFAIVLIGAGVILFRRRRDPSGPVADEPEALTPDEVKALKQLQETSAKSGAN